MKINPLFTSSRTRAEKRRQKKFNQPSKALVHNRNLLTPISPQLPIGAKRIAHHPRLDKNASLLTIPRKAELRSCIVRGDPIAAIAVAAGAVVRSGAGACVAPDVDARGCDVTFVFAGEWDAGGTGGIAVVGFSGKEGCVVGVWRGDGEDGDCVGEEEGSGEEGLGKGEKMHVWFLEREGCGGLTRLDM